MLVFLSTLSLRRATGSNQAIISQTNNFYPRSPCGERHQTPSGTTSTTYFYPRSPCGERQDSLTDDVSTGGFLSTLSLRRATITTITICIVWIFLSTLSLRRATPVLAVTSEVSDISIHALLAESDRAESDQRHSPYNFYPRSPCGELLATT